MLTSLHARVRWMFAAGLTLAALSVFSPEAIASLNDFQLSRDCRISSGKCVIVGPGSSELAAELANSGDVRVFAVEPDATATDAGRVQLYNAGLYGKVTVHTGDIDTLKLPPLQFDLLICDLTGQPPAEKSIAAMYRLVKPGGKAVLKVGPGQAAGYQKLMVDLGLDEANISAGSGQIIYSRPGPDPNRDWRSWFNGPFHQCAANSPDFAPPLVEIWSWQTETSARHNWVVPIIGDGVVVYHEWQFGYINGHDAYTGELLWSHPSKFPDQAGVHKRLWMSVPAVVGGTALVATTLQELTCIDLKTGKTLWVKSIPSDIDWDQEPGWQSLRHLSTHDGKYYLLVNKEKALYYEPRTGKETVIEPLLPYRAYTKFENQVFYPKYWNYSHQPMTWTVKDEKTDEQIYTFESSGRPRFCLVPDQRMLLHMEWEGYKGLDIDSRENVWGGPYMPWTCGAATSAGKYAWSTASGITYSMDARTGQVDWMIRNTNSCVPPAIANGILYTMSNNSLRIRAFASANLLKLPARRSQADANN